MDHNSTHGNGRAFRRSEVPTTAGMASDGAPLRTRYLPCTPGERTDGPLREPELSPAARAPDAAGRSRRRVAYLVVGPERRVRGQWGRHGGGWSTCEVPLSGGRVGAPSSLRYVLVFPRARTKGDDARCVPRRVMSIHVKRRGGAPAPPPKQVTVGKCMPNEYCRKATERRVTVPPGEFGE